MGKGEAGTQEDHVVAWRRTAWHGIGYPVLTNGIEREAGDEQRRKGRHPRSHALCNHKVGEVPKEANEVEGVQQRALQLSSVTKVITIEKNLGCSLAPQK